MPAPSTTTQRPRRRRATVFRLVAAAATWRGAVARPFGRGLPCGSNCSWSAVQHEEWVRLLHPGGRDQIGTMPTQRYYDEVFVEQKAYWKGVDPSGFQIEAFNPGHGTSGTRSATSFLCGLVTNANGQKCGRPKDEKAVKAVFHWNENLAKVCVAGHSESDACRIDHLLPELRELVAEALNSDVERYKDTPWTYISSELFIVAPDVWVIWTRRNPLAWARSRLRSHAGPGSAATKCRHSLVDLMELPTYLDIPMCLQAGLLAGGDYVYAKDILLHLDPHEDRNILAAEYAVHEHYIESLLTPENTHMICWWDSDPGVDGVGIAEDDDALSDAAVDDDDDFD